MLNLGLEKVLINLISILYHLFIVNFQNIPLFNINNEYIWAFGIFNGGYFDKMILLLIWLPFLFLCILEVSEGNYNLVFFSLWNCTVQWFDILSKVCLRNSLFSGWLRIAILTFPVFYTILFAYRYRGVTSISIRIFPLLLKFYICPQ